MDEKRARGTNGDNTSLSNQSIASPRRQDTPEVVVTDSDRLASTTSLPRTGDYPDPGLGADEEVPPAYSEHHDQLSLHHNGFEAGAELTGKCWNPRARYGGGFLLILKLCRGWPGEHQPQPDEQAAGPLSA